MRGIRIWHLAALALSVPLLAAALPPGCYGALNPQFVDSFGVDPATQIAPPSGYNIIAIFDETGWWGRVDITITTTAGVGGWLFGFGPLGVSDAVFACDVIQMDLTGGIVRTPDASDPTQLVDNSLEYSGPVLDLGEELECGCLVKLELVPLVPVSPTLYSIQPPFTDPAVVQNLEFHIFVEIIK